MLVDGGNLYHRDVAGNRSATVEFLGLTQENGNIVSPAGLHVLADIASHEESLVEEDALVLFVRIGCGTFSVEVMDTYVFQFSVVSPAAESLNEDLRGACNAAEVDMVAALDNLDRFVG